MLPGQNVRLGFRKSRFSFGLRCLYSMIMISSTDEKHCETEKRVMTISLRAILHTDKMCKSFTLTSMM